MTALRSALRARTLPLGIKRYGSPPARRVITSGFDLLTSAAAIRGLVGVAILALVGGWFGAADTHGATRPGGGVPWWMLYRLPADLDHADALSWLAHTNQPPPPALQSYWPQFVAIYMAYQSIPASAAKPSFAAWLIMNGVIDPTTHHAMLLLYIWAERNSP